MDIFDHHPLLAVSTASNYLGTNPLEGFTIMPDRMKPLGLNPNLYQNFTFREFPSLSYVAAPEVTTNTTRYTQATTSTANDSFSVIVSETPTETQYYLYNETLFYSSLATYAIDYYTYYTHLASSMQVQSLTFDQRFGTELQTVYASEFAATDVFSTYESSLTRGIYSSTDVIYSTLITLTEENGVWNTYASFEGLYNVYDTSGTLNSGSTYLISANSTILTDGIHAVGSSMFVEMLGSDVFTGLLVTTNSVVINDNEEINSYYSETLSYEINVANLTAALNSVAGDENTGNGTITVTYFSWEWYTTTAGWAGTQVTDFPTYTFETTVNSYLYYTYNTTIDNKNTAVTEVESLLTVENNNVANAQTYLNDSVTTLQSDVSLAGEIISALSSAIQSIINYM